MHGVRLGLGLFHSRDISNLLSLVRPKHWGIPEFHVLCNSDQVAQDQAKSCYNARTGTLAKFGKPRLLSTHKIEAVGNTRFNHAPIILEYARHALADYPISKMQQFPLKIRYKSVTRPAKWTVSKGQTLEISKTADFHFNEHK